MRIVIAGGPRTGKTTLAEKLPGPVMHTDDLINLPWGDQSTALLSWLNSMEDLAATFDDAPRYTLEGCMAVRGLRKWLEANAHNTDKPCEVVIFLSKVYNKLNIGQIRLTSQVRTIYEEIKPELRRRGVRILEEV